MKTLLVPVSVVAAVAAATAGCGGSRSGSPTAAGEPTTGTTTAPTTGPARPGEIDLTGADPCQAVTEQQRAAWAVDRPPRAGTISGGVLAGAPSCAFGSTAEQTGFVITLSQRVGLTELVERARAGLPRQDLTIGGFPAISQEGVSSAPDRGSGECYVDVDVAANQLLEVQFSQLSASQDKRLPVATLCAEAQEVAEAALTTLQGG